MRLQRTILCILGALGVAGYLLWPTILRVVAQEALRSAQRSGARISWEGLTIDGFTASLESFGAWLPGPVLKGGIRPPIKLDLGKTQLRVRPWSLIKLDPVVDFTLGAYGGSIEGTATDVRSAPRISVTLRDVDLGKHDQFRALGISSAVVSGSLSDFQLAQGNSVKGSFDVLVRRIEVPTIPQSLSLIKLPPLSDGEINVRGSVDTDSVEVPEVKINSSYGAAQGSGRALNLRQPGGQSAAGDFHISISDALHPQVSKFLPILSGNVLKASTRAFKARMVGSPCARISRSFGDLQLGTLCVRFVPVGAL